MICKTYILHIAHFSIYGLLLQKRMVFFTSISGLAFSIKPRDKRDAIDEDSEDLSNVQSNVSETSYYIVKLH